MVTQNTRCQCWIHAEDLPQSARRSRTRRVDRGGAVLRSQGRDGANGSAGQPDRCVQEHEPWDHRPGLSRAASSAASSPRTTRYPVFSRLLPRKLPAWPTRLSPSACLTPWTTAAHQPSASTTECTWYSHGKSGSRLGR